jgi:Mg2+ and Co2+ transporter CorA
MAVITGVGLFLVSVLTAALGKLLVEEIDAWNPSIIHGLVRLAVRCLPENLRERFAEEWQSHVNEVPGKLSKLLASAGFLLAAAIMGLHTALTERRNRLLEEWHRCLAQLEGMYSQSDTVLDEIQRALTREKDLISLQDLVTDLHSSVSDGRKELKELADLITAASAIPPTSTQNLALIAFAKVRGSKMFNEISRKAEEITERNDRMIKYLAAKESADHFPDP